MPAVSLDSNASRNQRPGEMNVSSCSGSVDHHQRGSNVIRGRVWFPSRPLEARSRELLRRPNLSTTPHFLQHSVVSSGLRLKKGIAL